MPEIVVWGIPTCQSTRKALRFIERLAPRAPVFRNLREVPPTKTMLKDVLKKYGGKKVFNISGQAYREGGYKDRVSSMSGAQIIDALLADPMLLKRPVVISTKGLVVGFDENDIRALL